MADFRTSILPIDSSYFLPNWAWLMPIPKPDGVKVDRCHDFGFPCETKDLNFYAVVGYSSIERFVTESGRPVDPQLIAICSEHMDWHQSQGHFKMVDYDRKTLDWLSAEAQQNDLATNFKLVHEKVISAMAKALGVTSDDISKHISWKKEAIDAAVVEYFRFFDQRFSMEEVNAEADKYRN